MSPALRLTVQGVAIAVLATATFIIVTSSSEIDETAASVLVAIVFGVATVLQVRRSQRRQHTVELLYAFQSGEVLSAADTWMARRIAAHQPIGQQVPEDDDRHVTSLLDYYEFLSSLALRGVIDVPLLLSLRGGSMSRCLHLCRGYIDHRRTTVGGELYRSFESLVEEYARRTSDRKEAGAAGMFSWWRSVRRVLGRRQPAAPARTVVAASADEDATKEG